MLGVVETLSPLLPLFVVYGAFAAQGLLLIVGGAAVIKGAPPLPAHPGDGH
jgi:hypothetical protein